MGGLLEHTVSVAGLAREVAGRYPELDRDLLVSGALLHDVGQGGGADPGSAPGLQRRRAPAGGTWCWACACWTCAWAGSRSSPAALGDHLRHFIASHHGQEAFGSPVKPKTREAMVLHMLDDLDAKLAMAGEALAADQEPGNWTRFHRLLERHLYTGPDPLEDEPGPARREPEPSAGPEPEPEPEPARSAPSLFGD